MIFYSTFPALHSMDFVKVAKSANTTTLYFIIYLQYNITSKI